MEVALSRRLLFTLIMMDLGRYGITASSRSRFATREPARFILGSVNGLEHDMASLSSKQEVRVVRRCSAWIALVAAAVSPMAFAALTAEQKSGLNQSFQALSAAENVQAASHVIELLRDADVSDEAWNDYFRREFNPPWFTPVLTRFWDAAITGAGADRARTAMISGRCAAAVLGRVLGQGGLGAGALRTADTALLWLEQMGPGLTPPAREKVLASFEAGLGAAPAALVPAPGADPAETRTLFQLSLTLGAYGSDLPNGRQTVSRLLRLPDRYRFFWETHGIFLFDKQGLSPAHFESLSSLAAAIPARLHRIAALVVPETTGIDPRAPGVLTPGQLVFLPLIPMDRMTDPREYGTRTGQVIAPEFTIRAAQEIVRAIQAEQFARRPDLVVRRDLLLGHARETRVRYIRRTIPAGLYQQQPDELLPAIAFLWFIDTGATFRMAFDVFQVGVGDPMDSLLLFADLMSGGGATTYLYRTDLSGRVFSEPSPIGRKRVGRIRLPRPDAYHLGTARVPTDLDFVTGIAVNGYRYVFFLSDSGRTVRWTRTR